MIEREVAAVDDRIDAAAADSDSYWHRVVVEADRDRRMRRRAWSVLGLAFAAALYLACRLITAEPGSVRPGPAADKPPALPPSQPAPLDAQRLFATPAAAASLHSGDAPSPAMSAKVPQLPETPPDATRTSHAIASVQAARARQKPAPKRPAHSKEELPPAQTAGASRPDYSWVDRYAP